MLAQVPSEEFSASVYYHDTEINLTKHEIFRLKAQLNEALKEIETKEKEAFLAKNLKLFP